MHTGIAACRAVQELVASIPGMCTSTSTSRHWPFFTRRRASSGSEVGIASYPMSAITADSISSCAGSSSRMHGVSADFGATISTDFVEAIPTMLYFMATRLPYPAISARRSLKISIGWIQIHNFLETIGVIALHVTRLASGSPISCRLARRSSQFVVRTLSFAPLRSSGSTRLPIPVQLAKKQTHALPRTFLG